MTLNELKIKSSYDSDEDNILRDFYIPSLKNSCLYKRIASYYSSSSLAVASEGIVGFLQNEGKMQLLINVALSEEDFKAIEEGIKNPEKVISEMVIKDLSNLKKEIEINHLKVLSWLIATKRIEIKVAILKENSRGIFHQKVGLLFDEVGNKIAFSGSENETASGFIYNIEEFKVFRSWIKEERKYLEEDEKKFSKFWEGEGKRIQTINLPEAIERELLKIAPKTKEDLQKLVKKINEFEYIEDKKKLRDYQKKAIDLWMKNDKKGILEMATGSGKTFTSISIIKKIIEIKKPLLVVIACPFQHLVTQWGKELESQGLSYLLAFGNRESWTDKLADRIHNLKNGYQDSLIIITTYNTSCKENFIDLIEDYTGESFYIGDEVHSVGAESRREGLLKKYNMRLGLSATPSRWMDDEGTEIIEEYFGKTIFEFSLNEAIENGFLTSYKYFPHIAYLSEEEMQEYESFTPKMARLMNGDKKENWERLSLLLIKRQKIITNASSKIDVLRDILDKEEDIKKTLIYCSDKQIDLVQKYLQEKNIVFHRFTSKEDNKKRENILSNFDNGTYDVLLAIKCLDEGVDVPSTKKAIIMASSGNPREYIQRRGRILRKHPSKSYSIIHDIIILPPKSYFYKYESSDMDKKMLKKELKRYIEFSKFSMNPIHSTKMIIKIMEDYGLI